MREAKLKKYKLGEILPLGYFERQLLVQADGLSGHLPTLSDEASDNSAWLGGKGDGWERGPYYVYGLLPLAVLTKSDALLSEVKKWIDHILGSQRQNGDYGPEKVRDQWPRMVVNKLLIDWREATDDERVVPFLTRYYHYLYSSLDKNPYSSWAWVRGYEELVGIYELYGITRDEFLLTLAEKVKAYSLNWAPLFLSYPFTKPSADYMRRAPFSVKKVTFFASDFIRNLFGEPKAGFDPQKVIRHNECEFSRFYHITHGVNIAMAYKYPLYEELLFGAADGNKTALSGYRQVQKYHGFATELFSCDEHTMGPDAAQGTELCTAAEAMNSFEKLYELSGDSFWADRLETVGFGVLPALFTPDMCAHQYVSQPNQISATSALRKWYDSYFNANIYGLKPNYACCMANMHQAFPKLAEHFSYREGDKTVIAIAAPHAVHSVNRYGEYRIAVTGEYPFSDRAEIRMEKGEADILIRRPGYSPAVTVGGTSCFDDYIPVHLSENQSVSVVFERRLCLKRNNDGSLSVMYGGLLMALPIEHKKRVKKDRGRFSDVEFFPTSPWQYGIDEDCLKDAEITVTGVSSPYPFAEAPVSVVLPAYKMNWPQRRHSADDPAKAESTGERVKIRLVPFAVTTLRISQFPKVSAQND